MTSPKPQHLAALVFIAGLLALETGAVMGQEHPSSPDYRAATEALVCQCGCNSPVATCKMERCHSAEPMREEIWERLENGESVASVLEVFRERYGLTVLAAPPTTGFHLTAWVTPFIVLFLGFFVTRGVLRSWRRQTESAEDAVSSPELTEARRKRIEKELREFPS